MENALTYLTQGISTGLIYGIVALGFVLIYKSSHVLNFAVGEFLVVGAYVAWAINSGITSVWPGIAMVWVTLITFIAVIVTASAMGLFIERVAIRPLIGQPVLGIILMTLAISAILRSLVLLIWGPVTKHYMPRLFPSDAIRLGDIVIRQEYVWGLAVAVILLIIFTYFFRFSRSGLAMRATSEDHQLARGTGIRVKAVFAQSWAICALVAGVVGVILASLTNVSLDLTPIGLKSIAVVLVGGLESIPGAIVAGLIIGIAESMAIGYLDPLVGGGIGQVFAFVIAIISLLIWPYGLFGLRRIERI